MSSYAAPRCRHIKINGTQCGSPALRDKDFCFYHQQNRPMSAECYYKADEYSTGQITLPYFEDAHSIQTVIRQIVQMVLQKRLARDTASTLLYALQIASSNLKRMELEKPQPEQVVTDVEQESECHTPIATPTEGETVNKSSDRNSEKSPDEDLESSGENLPPGTIQACFQPRPVRQANRPALSGVEGSVRATQRLGAMLETRAAQTPSRTRVT
jgi:hypothetical protein